MLSVSRRPCEISHPKLEEYIVEDFMTLPIADPKLQGYDACFFCAGKSNIGMSKEDYYHLSYEITMHFAKAIGQKRLQGGDFNIMVGSNSSDAALQTLKYTIQ